MRASQVTACTLTAIAWGVGQGATAHGQSVPEAPPEPVPVYPGQISEFESMGTGIVPPEGEVYQEFSPVEKLEVEVEEQAEEPAVEVEDPVEDEPIQERQERSPQPTVEEPKEPLAPLPSSEPAPVVSSYDRPIAMPAPQPVDQWRQGSGLAQVVAQSSDRVPNSEPTVRIQNTCGRSPQAVPIPSLAQRMAERLQRNRQGDDGSSFDTTTCPFPKFTTTKVLYPAAKANGSGAIAPTSPLGRLAAGTWRFPLAIDAPITSSFGWRIHPITGDRRFHDGVDFGAPEGTPVLAAAAGQVQSAGWMGGYGLTVVVDHGSSQQTLYAHLSKIVVEPGQRVEGGALLGQVGNTGNSTGPHLHFEQRRFLDHQWVAVEPFGADGADGVDIPGSETVVLAAATSGVNSAVQALPTVRVAATPTSLAPCKDSCGEAPTLQAVALPSLPPLPEVPDVPFLPSTTPVVELSQAPQPLADRDSQSFVGWLEDCQALIDQGDYGQALATCDRAISINPRNAEAWLSRGRLLMSLGRYPEAIAALTYVLHHEPNSSQVLTDRCSAYARHGNVVSAVRDCDRALELNQEWGDRSPALAYQHRGLLYLQAGDYDQAIADFNQILAQNPDHSLALTYRCRGELGLGQTETALASCDRALELDRQWGDTSPALAWYHRGLVLTQLERPTDALAAYDQAIALEPGQASLWTHRGLLLERLDRFDAALISLQQATQLAPKSSLAWLHQATVLNRLDQSQAALVAVEQALQGDGQWGEPGITEAWAAQSQAYLGLQRYEEAIATADQVISHQPSHGPAWGHRAVALGQVGRTGEALAAITQALEVQPQSPDLWLQQGQILSLTGQEAEAIAAYDQALSHHPSRSLKLDLLTQRSRVLWRLGQFDAALATTQEVLNLDPTSLEGWHIQGMVLLSLDRHAEAIAAYDYAIALDPKSIQAWTGRGSALRFAGQEDAAQQSFRQADDLRQAQRPSALAPSSS